MICYLVETTRVRVEFDERAGKSLDRKHFRCRRSDYIFSCYHINSVSMPIFLELFKDKPHQISPLCTFNQAVYVGLRIVLADNCKSLLTDLSDHLPGKLQRVQNNVARVAFREQKYDITPLPRCALAAS